MRTEEKKGIEIEVKAGKLADLIEDLVKEIEENPQQRADAELYDEIVTAFRKQSLSGQHTTITMLYDDLFHNLVNDNCKFIDENKKLKEEIENLRGQQEPVKEDK